MDLGEDTGTEATQGPEPGGEPTPGTTTAGTTSTSIPRTTEPTGAPSSIDLTETDFGQTIRGHQEGDRVFSRFVLRRLIGRGGMGVVWLADDESLQREVALKFLPEMVSHDPAAIDELKEETRRGLELSHPHIVKVLDFLQDIQHAAISMEFVDGESMAKLRTSQPNKVFETTGIRRWVGQLLDALNYAHTQIKLVHRDLKPANLIVNRKGALKVMDFGIARSIADSVYRATMVSPSVGTQAYMSPQQAMGRPASIADDIYAIGSTLYEMLTGKPPFYSGDIGTQLQHATAPSMTERRREFGVQGEAIPQAWEQAVAACLAKEPEQRPPSVAEVGRMLGISVAGAEMLGAFEAGMPTAPSGAVATAGTGGMGGYFDTGPGTGYSTGTPTGGVQLDTGPQPQTPTARTGPLQPIRETSREEAEGSARSAGRKKKSALVPVLILALLVLAALGGGVYFGYEHVRKDFTFLPAPPWASDDKDDGKDKDERDRQEPEIDKEDEVAVNEEDPQDTEEPEERTEEQPQDLAEARAKKADLQAKMTEMVKNPANLDEVEEMLEEYKLTYGEDDTTKKLDGNIRQIRAALRRSGQTADTTTTTTETSVTPDGQETEIVATDPDPDSTEQPDPDENQQPATDGDETEIVDRRPDDTDSTGQQTMTDPETVDSQTGETTTTTATDLTEAGDKRLVVGDESGFSSVQEAIDAAQPGETVEILSGRYEGSVNLKPGISLQGANAQTTFLVVDGQRGSLLTARDAGEVNLRNLTLEHSGDDIPSNGAPVIDLVDTQLTMENCVVRKGVGDGIIIASSKDVVIRKTEFSKHVNHGIVVESGSEVLLEDVTVSGCGVNGLNVRHGGTVAMVKGGSFTGCAGSGMRVELSARLACDGAIVRGNSIGIVIFGDGTQASIINSNLSQNDFETGDSATMGSGIWIEAGGEATIKGNTLNDNPVTGITIIDPGYVVKIENNTAQNNAFYGAYLAMEEETRHNASSISIVKNDFSRNGQLGIVVRGQGASPVVAQNKLEGYPAPNENQRFDQVFELGATPTTEIPSDNAEEEEEEEIGPEN